MVKKAIKQGYQRIRLIKELILTERTYILFLSQYMQNIIQSLRYHKEKKKNILESEKEFDDLFCNFEEIKIVNSSFLVDLEKEGKKTNPKVGYVFNKHSDNFKICIFF
jgi:hypothetical protein